VSELEWSLTIHTHGQIGIWQEHSSTPASRTSQQEVKTMMRMGSNISLQSVQAAAKSLGVIELVCTKFEEEAKMSTTKTTTLFLP